MIEASTTPLTLCVCEGLTLPNSRGITVRACPEGVQHTASVEAHLLLYPRPAAGAQGGQARGLTAARRRNQDSNPRFRIQVKCSLGSSSPVRGGRTGRESPRPRWTSCVPARLLRSSPRRRPASRQLRGPCEQEGGRKGHGTWNRESRIKCARWDRPAP